MDDRRKTKAALIEELNHLRRQLADQVEEGKAEAALRESEERYRRLADQAPDIIYRIRFKPDMRFEYINPAFTQVTGYSAEEFFQDPELTMALVHPEDIQLVLDSQKGILPSGPTRIRWIHKDGSVIWTEQHTTRILDDDGNFIALEGIARDITEKIRTEDAYKESEARLQLAIRSVQMVIWEWNFQTGETTFSEGIEDLFGVDPGTFPISFETFIGMVHPEDRDQITNGINTYSTAEKNDALFTIHFRILWPNEEVHWLEAKGTVTPDSAGQPERFLGTVMDVTQRVSVTQALAESEERYRSFSEAVKDGVLIHDQGRIIDANQGLADMFAYKSPEEMIGLNGILDLMHADYRSLVMNRIASKEEGAIELVGIRRDNSTFPVEIEAKEIIYQGQPARVLVGRDITERKAGEAAIRDSERRLRAQFAELDQIYQSTPIGLALMDKDLRYLKINEAMAAMNGIPMEAHLGKSIWEIIPDLAEQIESKYRDVFETGEPILNFEARSALPDNPQSEHIWLGSYYPLVTRGGQVSSVIAVVQDITERVRSEEALAASETRLRLALEASGMETWEWNIITNEVIWSDNAETIFGLEPGTFAGTYEAYLDLIYPADRENISTAISEFVAHGQERDSYRVEHRLEFPDGQIRWMEGQGNIFREADGQPIKMIGTVLDITERKEAEQALRASETSLKEAQQLAHIGNFELDLETYHLIWSDEMYNIHGLERAQKPSGEKLNFDIFVHPDDRQLTWESSQKVITTGEPSTGEFRILRPNGEIRYVQGQSRLRKDEHGESTHLIGTVQDITDRKLAELKVQHTADRLRVIHEIDQSVLAGKSPAEIVKTSLMSIRELLPCDHAGVILFDYESNGYELLVVESEDDTQITAVSDKKMMGSPPDFGLKKTLMDEKVLVIHDTKGLPDEILSMAIGPLEGRSGILAAMISQNELIGVVNFISTEPDHFSNNRIEIAAEVADSLAIAIQHARLTVSQRRYIDQLESLRQASLQLTSNLALAPVLDTVLEYTLSLISALDAHIFLYDGNQLSFGAARWADHQQIQPYKKVREEGITWSVARTGERIVIPEVNQHPLFKDWQWGGAIIGLPLLRADQVIGVMTVAFGNPHRFSDDELRILDLLADQVAIAIDNANLYTSERSERRKTAALAASARDLSAVLDQDRILQLTLDRLQEVVSYDTASLVLIQDGRLEFAAARGFSETQDIRGFRKQYGGMLPLEAELTKSRTPIIIADVSDDDRWIPGDTDQRVRSWLGVPLVTGVQTLGFLMLDKYEPGFYNKNSSALAGAFAAHAAIALQNARLFENERYQTRQLEGLHQLSTGISAQLDLEVLLETTVQYAIELLGGKSGGLYLYRPAQDAIEWSVAIGESVVSIGSTLQKGEGLSGKVWEHDTPMFVGDYRNWEGQAEIYEGYPWKSIIGAPISRSGTFYGVLNVLTDRVDAFSDSDLKVLDLFSNQAAIALENAQLFENLNHRNQELTRLFELGQQLTRQLDLDTLLSTIASAIVATISSVEASSVWLVGPNKENLEVKSWAGHPDDSMEGVSVPISGSLAGQIYASKQAKIFSDVQNNPHLFKFGAPPKKLVLAIMAVPLLFEGEIIGVMTGDNFKDPHAFSENDLQLFQSVGGAASIAIQNAFLFDSVNLQSIQLRDLTAQLSNMEEMERKRLAQELHDRVGQNLTALSINLNMVKSFLPPEVADTLGSRIDDSQALVGETAQHIRDVMADLRPPVLDDYGLLAALRWYGEQFTDRTGIHVTIEGDDQIPRLNLALETTLFRIAQEALTNIARHADAKNVRISLSGPPGNTQFLISDDGKGINQANLTRDQQKAGWGLQIMQERIEAIGGSLLIETPPDSGTIIKVAVDGGLG